MRLTFEQITSAANGIIRTEENDLGLELHRFTREQEGFFYQTHPLYCKESFFNGYFATNCRTCAGVTLDFVSDVKNLIIKFGHTDYAKSRINRIQYFDLYVDNEFAASYKTDETIVYASSGRKQRITLYFPSYAFPIISSIDLEDASVFLPQKKKVDILFLGDSITQGGYAVNPSNSYVMRVARNMNIGILNQGNSGFVYDARSIEKVCEPKVIVTAYGANDYHRKNLELIESDTMVFLKKLREVYKNAKIVSILTIWRTWDGQDENYKNAERACLKSIYDKYSDYTIDGYSLIPHDKKYFVDGVHPNDEGFAFYGINLTAELDKIMGSF